MRGSRSVRQAPGRAFAAASVRILLPVVVAGSLLAPGARAPAVADDHEIPKTVLHVDATRQRGKLGSSCWTSRTETGFVRGCADLMWSWPRRKTAPVGRTARLVFLKLQPPRNLSLQQWRRVRSDPRFPAPVGNGRVVPYTLQPVVEDGVVGWQAVFQVPATAGPYYLSAFAVWSDEEGSFLDQDASWRFHLNLR